MDPAHESPRYPGAASGSRRHDRTCRRTGTIPDVSTAKPYRSKRLVDLAVLAMVAVPALTLGVLCSIAVGCTSPGPVFFRQERIGRAGRPFRVWKFRTMVAGENPIIPDATRITRVGGVLRRYSLDELPQLLNVAVGEMSIVGPRPTLAYQVERYDDHQRRRLQVRPGLTGLAQVNGRNALSWGDRIDFDVEYVETQGPALDLRLIARTARAVLGGEGVEGHAADDPIASVAMPAGTDAAVTDGSGVAG